MQKRMLMRHHFLISRNHYHIFIFEDYPAHVSLLPVLLCDAKSGKDGSLSLMSRFIKMEIALFAACAECLGALKRDAFQTAVSIYVVITEDMRYLRASEFCCISDIRAFDHIETDLVAVRIVKNLTESRLFTEHALCTLGKPFEEYRSAERDLYHPPECHRCLFRINGHAFLDDLERTFGVRFLQRQIKN